MCGRLQRGGKLATSEWNVSVGCVYLINLQRLQLKLAELKLAASADFTARGSLYKGQSAELGAHSLLTFSAGFAAWGSARLFVTARRVSTVYYKGCSVRRYQN
jgi:hypothetical protein